MAIVNSQKEFFKITNCKKFTGYKPCEPYKVCPCDDPVPYGQRILIVNLDHMGSVLMTTAMLPAIKRKYPESTIHWITRGNAIPLLENNPYLDHLWVWNSDNRMVLSHMFFDEVLNADKNQNSATFTMALKAKQKLGFGINENGVIVPLNREASYNYCMGLDDNLKFWQNTRTSIEILAETWRFDFRGDEYVLYLTDEEQVFCREFRKELGVEEGKFVVGFNTGCSSLFPLKKMTIEQHVDLIRKIAKVLPDTKILLLGGEEDIERNRDIKKRVGSKTIETPTTEGLRNGILYVNLCDLIVTGDSLGMHIAIGLKKNVIAWFGLSCGAEVELYGRGIKVLSDLECSPCWKQSCDDSQCLEKLNLDQIFQAVARYHKAFIGSIV